MSPLYLKKSLSYGIFIIEFNIYFIHGVLNRMGLISSHSLTFGISEKRLVFDIFVSFTVLLLHIPRLEFN